MQDKKINKLLAEKSIQDKKINMLLAEKSIQDKKINMLQDDINKLKEDNKNKQNNINLFKLEINKFQEERKAKGKNSKKYKDEEKTKIDYLTRQIEKMMDQLNSQQQEIIELRRSKKDITERDNYRAIVYIILLMTGKHTFETIWRNTKEIITNLKDIEIDKDLKEIFNYSNEFVFVTDIEAHESTTFNIINNLFPKADNKVKKTFSDDLLNETKQVIAGLKNYLMSGKNDKLFEKKMKKIYDEISIKK